MVKKLITPSVHKDLCTRLQKYAQKRQFIQLRRIRTAIVIKKLVHMHHIIEDHLKPNSASIRSPSQWRRSTKGHYYVSEMDLNKPKCDLYFGLLLQLLKENPKITKLSKIPSSFRTIGDAKKLWKVGRDVEVALAEYKSKLKRTFLEEDQLAVKKRRFIRTLKHVQWDDTKPLDFDYNRWVGNTAARYQQRRQEELDLYRDQMVDLLGWFRDNDMLP